MPDEGHVSGQSAGIPPEFHNRGRQTFYKGVKMRSRLEATAAALFDRFGAAWQYEPMCFASEAGQYLPDFRVEIIWASEPGAGLFILDPVEMVSWAAPYADEFGRPWTPTETSAACWEVFPDEETGDPYPGAMCGRLHIRFDPTSLHNWWNPDARASRS